MTVCRPDSWVCLGETTNAALPSTIFAVDDSRVTIANDGASVWVKTSAQDKVIVGV